jgi:heterogeneous nuclear ribonucleoprotein A1/A3
MSHFGEVLSTKILKKSGKSRGFGFVTFNDPAIANRVIPLSHFIEGKKVSQALTP